MYKTGIYINDSTQPFTEQILNHIKTVETRTHLGLRRFAGMELYIIRTGKGKPMVVGKCWIRRMIQWWTYEAFREDYIMHRIKPGTKYDWTLGRPKVGYELSRVERVEPYPLPKGGQRHGRYAYTWIEED